MFGLEHYANTDGKTHAMLNSGQRSKSWKPTLKKRCEALRLWRMLIAVEIGGTSAISSILAMEPKEIEDDDIVNRTNLRHS